MERLDECYVIHGTGGFEACLVVQEVLQSHGLCSYTRWDPDPPKWRFFFETNLKPNEALRVLGKYAVRYKVRLR